MGKLFSKIGKRIEKTPFKVLFASILIFAILITGAIKVNMATGNETLVNTDNDAYISNHNMEKEFGGDAIMVLFEGEERDLFRQDNMEKMWNVEQRLKYNDNIFSFMGPASIVHQITDKQTSIIKGNVFTMGDGLGEMSEKLSEIGSELGDKDVPDPEEMENKLNSMMSEINPDNMMDEMMGQQKAELEDKMLPMSDGLGQMGERLTDIGKELGSKDVPNPEAIEEKLNGLTGMMDPNNPIFKEIEEDSREMQENIGDIGEKLGQAGGMLTQEADELPKKLEEMVTGMEDLDPDVMEKELEEEFTKIEANFTGKLDEIKDNINMEIPDSLKNAPEELEKLEETLPVLQGLPEQLRGMAEEVEDDQVKMQLNLMAQMLEERVKELPNLEGMAEALEGLPAGSDQVDKALEEMKEELVGQINGMKENIQNIIPDSQAGNPKEEIEEMSGQLAQLGELGENLTNISNQLENADNMMPDTSDLLNGIQAQMNQEIVSMRDNLSGGISPDELGQMSGGFVTMGDNLNQLSSGISQMVEGGEMLPDASEALSGMTDQMEVTIDEMKSNLSNGMSPEDLETMSEGFITMGENLNKISEGLETFHEKSDMMVPNFPHNQKELDNILYEDDGSLRDVFEDTVLDDNHHMIMIKLDGNLEDEVKDEIYADVSNALDEEEFEDIDYIVSGKPVLDSSLREEMKSNMMYMVGFAVVIMFIILNLVFKVRWKVLSLGIIFVSVIATLGLMGHLSVSMTMVSMAVFPILIGLGIDYSIQLQNRYEEEKSVRTTLNQIGTAVGIAVLATVLGFISLYASPVPMIKDFGKMLTIGVIISFIGSIFLLMPVLRARDIVDNKEATAHNEKIEKESFIDRLLGGTAKFVTKFSLLVIIISTVLAGIGLIADQSVGVETDIETFMPQDMDALDDIRYVRDIVGSTDQMVLFMEDENLLSENNIEWMQNTIKDIERDYSDQVTDIKSIDSLVDNFSEEDDLSIGEYKDIINEVPEGQKKMFLNEDENKGVILMNIKHMATEELEIFVEDINSELQDAPMDVSITGKSVLDVEMVKGLTEGRVKMTILGIGLVFLALLIVYRSFFKALIPVFPIILIVGMSGGIMRILELKYTPITATLGALVLGMGTEMTIMLLERYLEERNQGRDKEDAMSTTMKKIGKATVASGLTTVGGFSVLMLSKFVILKDFGLMTVINISLALMSTFVILPAILWILDRFIVEEKLKNE